MIPSGRTEVVCTVLERTIRYDRRSGQKQVKLMVQVDTIDGPFKAWGSCPKELDDGFELKGQQILLKATFEPKSGAFAFFKRPKGELLSVAIGG